MVDQCVFAAHVNCTCTFLTTISVCRFTESFPAVIRVDDCCGDLTVAALGVLLAVALVTGRSCCVVPDDAAWVVEVRRRTCSTAREISR